MVNEQHTQTYKRTITSKRATDSEERPYADVTATAKRRRSQEPPTSPPICLRDATWHETGKDVTVTEASGDGSFRRRRHERAAGDATLDLKSEAYRPTVDLAVDLLSRREGAMARQGRRRIFGKVETLSSSPRAFNVTVTGSRHVRVSTGFRFYMADNN